MGNFLSNIVDAAICSLAEGNERTLVYKKRGVS